jgi:NAD(P)-dependent dehydrogenase (short-subunit alcohol dehydrogenase family)
LTAHSGLGTVIITGGAQGLGRAVTDAVEKAGGTPVVFDIREPDRDVRFEHVDLADGRATEAAVRAVGDATDDLRGIVTAAGVDACGDLLDVDAEDWERVIAVNLVGTAAMVRAAVPYLERTAGRIVTVASTLGLRALPAATAYSASKFGVVGFTRAVTLELAGRVGVTMLIPGGMRTGFFDGRPEEFKPAADQQLNDPDDVARTVLFALQQPAGCEIRELIVTPSMEPSWP